jgi:hypothetical protein
MSLFRALIETVKLPVDIAADAITACGIANDKDEPHTVTRVRKIYKEVDEA